MNDSETQYVDHNAELGYANALSTGFRLLRMAEDGDPADDVHTNIGGRWICESASYGRDVHENRERMADCIVDGLGL